MRPYRTIRQPSESAFVVNKSRFIGRCFPVDQERAAEEILERLKKQEWDATHHCYAYRLGERGERSRSSDDGEPSGTAGMPILQSLAMPEITNVLCVVTRYFGGVLLGAGGLVRAYSRAASEALHAAVVVTMRPCTELTLEVPYPLWANVERLLRERTQPGEIVFLERVTATAFIPSEDAASFVALVTDATDGRVVPILGEEICRALDDMGEKR